MGFRRLSGLALVAVAASCGGPVRQPAAGGSTGAAPATTGTTPHGDAASGTTATGGGATSRAAPPANAPKAHPTFAKRIVGWKAITKRDQRTRIDAFAADYVAFLAAAKVPRRAVAGLMAAFGKGAVPLPKARRTAPPGTRYVLMGPAGKAAAFIRVGNRPIEEGARIVVAAVDAPRIDLKQQPLYDKAGFAMLDTALYGTLDLASWLVQPLALYLYAARPGAADGDADLVVGEADTDPVLMVPDLLPHLSGKVQRPAIVDSAERMDAIAARSRRGLVDYLRKHGVDETVFASAEVSLVPAGRPTFVGVDRGLIAGYGHSHRAMAYAAVRALGGDAIPHHTAIVIVVDKSEIGYTGSSGLGFVRVALNHVVATLAGQAPDILTTRRFYARSAALIADRQGGKRNKGVVLNPHGDDALPTATRRLLDALLRAKAQFQVVSVSNWGSTTRRLSQLDMDVVDMGIPATGHGTPSELVSVLDLHSAYLACAAWLGGAR